MSATPQIPRPVPRPEDDITAEFWQHCNRDELRFQRCTDCGTWRHLPRVMCAQCASTEWEWALSSGRGRLFSWTVTHRSPHPAFRGEVPFVVGIIEMEEGVRMLCRIREIAPEDLALDLPLEVGFERANDETSLPFFRPAQEADSSD